MSSRASACINPVVSLSNHGVCVSRSSFDKLRTRPIAQLRVIQQRGNASHQGVGYLALKSLNTMSGDDVL